MPPAMTVRATSLTVAPRQVERIARKSSRLKKRPSIERLGDTRAGLRTVNGTRDFGVLSRTRIILRAPGSAKNRPRPSFVERSAVLSGALASRFQAPGAPSSPGPIDGR